ncbi:hypothetical protein GCM10010466_33430 [Planomonospora alba]|uniref:Uncharacterized protein n=1 Tax=Planomonospora alba TaxID=161354 RepID=A0ABP6NCZ2_9ACTN
MLRHQLMVLQRQVSKPAFTPGDRFVLAGRHCVPCRTATGEQTPSKHGPLTMSGFRMAQAAFTVWSPKSATTSSVPPKATT